MYDNRSVSEWMMVLQHDYICGNISILAMNRIIGGKGAGAKLPQSAKGGLASPQYEHLVFWELD